MPIDKSLGQNLLQQVRSCNLCAEKLPMGPRPVVQWHQRARILVAGQAPGRKVHATGVPFNDPSGQRLRQWLGVSEAQFYDDRLFALLPMGFCFPGTGPSGDLPPRPECAPQWRQPLLDGLQHLQLTLVLGVYAQKWHFDAPHTSVTERVLDWQANWPHQLALPHPSPRNIGWFRRNPWFETDVVPKLQRRVAEILAG